MKVGTYRESNVTYLCRKIQHGVGHTEIQSIIQMYKITIAPFINSLNWKQTVPIAFPYD